MIFTLLLRAFVAAVGPICSEGRLNYLFNLERYEMVCNGPVERASGQTPRTSSIVLVNN